MLIPEYLRNTLHEEGENACNVWNVEAAPGVRTRTTAYQKSFFPQTSREWNTLKPALQNTCFVSSFETKIKDTTH